MPITHVVAQGDCFSKIARRYGFADYKVIYNDPANAELKKKRPNFATVTITPIWSIKCTIRFGTKKRIDVTPPVSASLAIRCTLKLIIFVLPGATP